MSNSFTNYHHFLIGRGTLELQPFLKHLEMDEETWFTMSEDERQEYTDMLFKTKLEEVEFVNCEREGSLNRTIPYDLSLTFDEFKPFLP